MWVFGRELCAWEIFKKQFTEEHWIYFIHIIMLYCKKFMSVKMEKAISSQWMEMKMNYFFLCWHDKISIDHSLKWVIFGLGFLTFWWISRKILKLMWFPTRQYLSQMLLFWSFYAPWFWIFCLVDWTVSASHTYLATRITLGTVKTRCWGVTWKKIAKSGFNKTKFYLFLM